MPNDTWTLVLPHRARLLRIARRRCASREEAEDIVQEAMIRCATYAALDPARVDRLLTAVTVRLCSNARRNRAVAARLAYRLADIGYAAPCDDEVIDRLYARWLAGEASERLSDAELAAASARAEGGASADVAAQLGTTTKAVEMSLRRARTKLSALRVTVLGFPAAAWRNARRTATPLSAATAVACALAVTPGLVDIFDGDRSPAWVAVDPPDVTLASDLQVVLRQTTPPPSAPRVRRDATPTRPRRVTPPRPPQEPKRFVVRGVTLPGGARTTDTTINIDDDEPIEDRLRRCVREGVKVAIGPGGIHVVCRGE